MALTVKQLHNALGEQFQMNLIAGATGNNAVFTWIHMLEDTNIVDFFWGNEIVVTSGLTCHTESDLLDLLNALMAKRCAALVLNTGKYIEKIPESIIKLCEENGVPLYTMPWHMSMNEFVRTGCMMLSQSQLSEKQLSQAIINAVNIPQDPGGYFTELDEFFDVAQGFRMLAIHIKGSHARLSSADSESRIKEQRLQLRIHTAMRGSEFRYHIFRNDRRIFILLNTRDLNAAAEYGDRVLDNIRIRLPDTPIELGIGDDVESFENLQDAYHSALSAQRCASLQGLSVVCFSEMGFYRLLYSVPNDDLLRSYYHDTVGPILEYDKTHNTNLLQTLFSYVKNNCSPAAVAEELFTHRNTVNYRISKIKELTGWSLETPSDRLPFLLAYHIGIILKI